MGLKNARIQRKLMSVILLTCLVVLLLMGTAYIFLEYSSYKNGLRSNIATIGNIVASNSSASLAFDSPKDATEILSALKAEPHIIAGCIYDISGKIFAKYPAADSTIFFPPIESKNGYWFEDGYLVGFQPIHQKDEKLGTLYLKSDLIAMHEQLNYFAIIGVLLIAGSLLVAYLLSKILQKSISQPILALEKTAEMISTRRDYSVRAEKLGNDEVGSLTDAFNHMLAQIENQNREITSFNQNLEKKVNERTLALRQQKEFVETIINSSVDLIAVLDDNLNFVMMNKRAEEYYSIKPEDIIGKKITEVFPTIKNSSSFNDLQRALKGESVYNASYKSPIIDSYFESFIIPLKNSENVVYGVLSIAHDISKIMETNQKLAKVNEELVKSNRDLEQFAYIASHDLQEPLRKIQTFTQLLGESFNNHQQLEKYHTKISQAASRMQNLIQDVLNFSRITKSEEAFVETDLNIILENLKTDFELLLKEREAIINHPVLPVVKAIPLQMSQLFSNLISNSLKYNDKKPIIDITLKYLTPEEVAHYNKLEKGVRYICLQFIDNGIGFESRFSEKIFDIFQRLHGKQTYSGTGIGLGLCKKIVENHHGIIFAQGEPNVGSVFTVILPA